MIDTIDTKIKKHLGILKTHVSDEIYNEWMR